MAKIRESEEHSKSKTMEHFLAGFKPDDSDWIKFLADAFFEIFCNYNFQMISLLKHPVDAWSKAMWKMASETVARIFDVMPMIEDEEKTLKKDHLIQCFLLGKSGAKHLKTITNLSSQTGRQILVNDGKTEKEYLSSNLINKPIPIYKTDKNVWLKSSDKVSQNYEFRYAFSHEKDKCTDQLDETDANFQFFDADQRDFLHDQKEIILKEIVNKFMAQDKQVVDSLKEVMLENFGDVLSDLQKLKEGQKELMEGQNELMTGQNELMAGQNEIFVSTQEINNKLDMLLEASQLQYKNQEKFPKDYIDLHEMVPMKRQDYVVPVDNIAHPGTIYYQNLLFMSFHPRIY